MKQLVFSLLIGLFAFGAIAYPATAPVQATTAEQEQEQKLKQEAEAECKTGSYGQDSTCVLKLKQEAEQRQRQRILGQVTEDKPAADKVHVPVDTALDGTTLAFVLGTGGVGSAAYMIRRKLT
ncbi:MAG: hypothetical protein WDZ94_00720 [Patescibacteria group bacterium]